MENQPILEFITQSRSNGEKDEQIKQNLLSVGWPVEEVERAFASAPVSSSAVPPVLAATTPVLGPSPKTSALQSKISDITEKVGVFFQKPRVRIVATTVLVLVVAFFVAKVLFTHRTPAKFVLKATIQDAAGIDAKSAFTLQSTQGLSASDIKKIVKFKPPVDFTVKQVASPNFLIDQAQAADGSGTTYTYQLVPTAPLATDIVYQSVIDDPGFADREYGWAFQVKADFQVIKTHPGIKATYVPMNTGIEVAFNRTNIQNIDQYFQISPKVDGKFQADDDTVVFLPKDLLAANTVYTVTVKKGLKAAGSDDTLENDYSFSFETQSSTYQPMNYFNFSNDFVESPTGIKTDLSVYSNMAGSSVDVSVYRISNPDDFLKSYQTSRNWDWGWTYYYRQNNGTAFNTAGKQAIVTFKPDLVTENYQSYIEIPQQLDRGMYVVDALFDGHHRQVWLQVTDATHYFSITHDTSLLWLDDFSSKSPLKNSHIEFLSSGGTQSLGNTDQDGLLQFATPNRLKDSDTPPSDPSFFKVTDAQSNTTFVKIADRWGYATNTVSEGDKYWKFISTDRYTYQMSDNVKFWGVVKSRSEDVRQKKVKVALYDSSRFWDYGAAFAEQQPVASTEVMISAFNTIEGNISFTGLDPKTYSLVVTLGDETVSQSSIEVLTYSKPAYQLGVTTSKSSIFAGDSVTFTVKGTFFDGTPLNDTKLNYTGYWNSSISGSVTLDNNGEAQVTLTPKYIENENTYYPRDLGLTFFPASAEQGEIEGSGDVLVFGPHLYLQADQEKSSGDNYNFVAKLNNIDINNQVPDDNGGFRTEYIGAPVSNYQVQAKITRITYNKVETGSYYDPINKTVSKTYNYVRSETNIDTITGTTDGNGEWKLAKVLPHAEDSYYMVEFSVVDAQGRRALSSVYAGYASYDYWRPQGLSLSIGNDAYEKEFSVNEPVNLSVQGYGNTEVANQPILYYRYQNNISKAVVQRSTTYSENFGNDFSPSVQYRAVVLGAYGFQESNSVFAIFKKSDNNIKIGITTDKDSYRPGDKIAIKLHVTDNNNIPLAAETNVAIVDEAVFHVLPYNWQQQILDSLYQTINTSPLTGTTVYLLPSNQGGGGGAEKGGCFTAGTQILLASGYTKAIEDIKVGDQLLTFKDTASRKMVPAIVQGISSHDVDSFLIINGSLQVTEEHKIFVNGNWDLAGNAKVGDSLTLANGHAEVIRSIVSKHAPHTAVYNIIVGTYHTYFADGYFVHNAEKGGSSVRDSFVDTAAFQTLHPDSAGNAQLDFTAPDDITSWRVTAQAFDANTLKAGEQTKLIPATLPLFINSVFSDTYLVGDNPQVKIGIYGTGYHADQDAQVTVSSPALKLNQTLTVKNHVGYVSLGNLTEGEYDITISAKQGSLQDILKRHIVVVKSYFAKPTVSTVDMTEGNQKIAGNDASFTKLLFTDAGRGKYYQDLVWDSYTGGIRVDQVAGSYFATDILNNYFHAGQSQDQLDLNSYQAGNSGIRLFPYSDPDLELSAKVADLAGSFVSANNLGDYFDNSLHDSKTDLHRQAIALYGLASLQKPVLTKLHDISKVKELAWQDKIYVALGLAKIGAVEEARELYQQSIRSHLRFDGPQAWYDEITDPTARVKLTDLTAVLATYTNVPDDASSLWNYMESHSPVKDLDILEKIMFIKSAIAKTTSSETKFHYQAGSKSDDVSLKNGDSYSVTLSSDELNSITFSNISGPVQVSSFYEQAQDPAALPKASFLKISRQYLVNGKATTNFKDGDIVRVKLMPSITGGLDGNYQIVDYLPSGMRPITNPYNLDLEQGVGCLWYPQKIVNNKLYFSIPNNFGSYYNCGSSVDYFARVVTKGDFTANPALIQSALNMDDLNISDSSKINIK